jgi:hypothetical protein
MARKLSKKRRSQIAKRASKKNPWIKFMKKHPGKTMKQLKKMYRRSHKSRRRSSYRKKRRSSRRSRSYKKRRGSYARQSPAQLLKSLCNVN